MFGADRGRDEGEDNRPAEEGRKECFQDCRKFPPYPANNNSSSENFGENGNSLLKESGQGDFLFFEQEISLQEMWHIRIAF